MQSLHLKWLHLIYKCSHLKAYYVCISLSLTLTHDVWECHSMEWKCFQIDLTNWDLQKHSLTAKSGGKCKKKRDNFGTMKRPQRNHHKLLFCFPKPWKRFYKYMMGLRGRMKGENPFSWKVTRKWKMFVALQDLRVSCTGVKLWSVEQEKSAF